MELGTKDDGRALWAWIRDLANAGENIVSAEQLEGPLWLWEIIVSREHTHVKIMMPREQDAALAVVGLQFDIQTAAAASVNQTIATMREIDDRSAVIYDTRAALERLYDPSDATIVATMREILPAATDAK